MTSKAASVWSIVHAERAQLVSDLRTVPAEAWSTPSLCAGWTVHDVLAHLLDTAKTSRTRFVRRMIAARFDFDGDNAAGVAAERRDDPTATLDAMDAVIGLTLTPPTARATRLVEAIVHGEDIRRPLGIAAAYPPAAVATALAYQARTAVSFHGGRERVQGLRLVATDTGIEIGDGPEVRGPAIDLLVVTSGRRAPGCSLEGPGAARLPASAG
ncbi:MAG: maleylpyruvate isomerase family mycothiol-dependent enzyme [Mycobacterium sp.]